MAQGLAAIGAEQKNIESIVGAVLGNAIGAAIRSDNVPFLVLLGVAIGLCLSGVTAFVIVRH